MCLGIPLQVQVVNTDGSAGCSPHGEPQALRAVNTGLLDRQPARGDWLLVHVNVAIRALDAIEARQIDNALRAVTAAAHGLPFEHLIADLVDREPQLPDHLLERGSEQRDCG